LVFTALTLFALLFPPLFCFVVVLFFEVQYRALHLAVQTPAATVV
jgi:hypothetical protein